MPEPRSPGSFLVAPGSVQLPFSVSPIASSPTSMRMEEMVMRHRIRAAVVPLVVLIPMLGVGVAEAQTRTSADAPAPAPFADARLKIEYNATDGDAGLQVFVDADAWRSLSITNPQGREVMRVGADDVIKDYGLTELFSESSEPPFTEFPFEEFKRLFPEGPYTFRGTTIDGGQLESVFRLTHRVPDGPDILSPAEDAVVSSEDMVVRWEPVTSPRGVSVVAYQVLVVADAPARGNPTRVLDVMLPASATRLEVPSEFLLPGGYKTEVLAIEAGGNQTLTEVAFTVRR
jgi:hypothetical protein